MMTFKRRIISLLITFAMIIGFIPVIELQVGANSRYVITNPYRDVVFTGSSAWRQYKAHFHAHTTNTDGRDTTRSTAERHFDLGYNIVAFADHNYTTVTPDQVGVGAMSRTRIEEMRNNRTTTGSTRSASHSGMLFVPASNERSGLRVPEIVAETGDDSSHHVSTFWSTIRNASEPVSTMLTRLAAEDTGIAVLNHPGRNTGASFSKTSSASTARSISNNSRLHSVYTGLFRQFPHMVGMEIINEFDNETQGDRVLWDNILTSLMPEGRPVWGFSNDDSHANAHVGFSYNLMLMPELTLGELRHSMQTGAFFAFSRVDRQRAIHPGDLRPGDINGSASRAASVLNLAVPEIRNIVVEADRITLTVDSNSTVEWFASSSRTPIATGNSINLANLNITGGYVRAEVFNTSRGILYTQPFGVLPAASARPAANLQSVSRNTFPAITLASGARPTEMGLNLPGGVTITTRAGTESARTAPASIRWTLPTNSQYNPSNTTVPQTFTVNGRIILPPGVTNTNSVNLNVSIQVTVRRDCSACTTMLYDAWRPDLTGRSVTGSNIGGNLGIQLINTGGSTASISGNAIRLTPTSGTYRGIRFHTIGGVFSGWNRATSFAPRGGITYRLTFNASVASGEGEMRILQRDLSLAADNVIRSVSYNNSSSTQNGLTTTPRQITYEWTQDGNEVLEIDTRASAVGTTIIISDLRIRRVVCSCVDVHPRCFVCELATCACCNTCGEPDCRCCPVCNEFPCGNGVDIWTPNFTGRTVSSQAITGLGIHSESSRGELSINGANLRFTPVSELSGSGRNLNIHVTNVTADGGHASWNVANSLVTQPDTRYRVTFTGSVTGGTTGQLDMRGNSGGSWQEVALNATPTLITYEWTQTGTRPLQLNSANTPLNTSIVISNLKVEQMVSCLDVVVACPRCSASPCVCVPDTTTTPEATTTASPPTTEATTQATPAATTTASPVTTTTSVIGTAATTTASVTSGTMVSPSPVTTTTAGNGTTPPVTTAATATGGTTAPPTTSGSTETTPPTTTGTGVTTTSNTAPTTAPTTAGTGTGTGTGETTAGTTPTATGTGAATSSTDPTTASTQPVTIGTGTTAATTVTTTPVTAATTVITTTTPLLTTPVLVTTTPNTNPNLIAPTILTSSLGQGTVGVQYSAALSASGTAPIDWSVIDGNLPSGLTINPVTGVISGTPLQAGTFGFVVQARNQANPAFAILSITINAGAAETTAATATTATTSAATVTTTTNNNTTTAAPSETTRPPRGEVYGPGDVTGTGTITITDALEILKYLAKLPSAIASDNGVINHNALNAARIRTPGVGLPTINDALEILKHLAKLESELDEK